MSTPQVFRVRFTVDLVQLEKLPFQHKVSKQITALIRGHPLHARTHSLPRALLCYTLSTLSLRPLLRTKLSNLLTLDIRSNTNDQHCDPEAVVYVHFFGIPVPKTFISLVLNFSIFRTTGSI